MVTWVQPVLFMESEPSEVISKGIQSVILEASAVSGPHCLLFSNNRKLFIHIYYMLDIIEIVIAQSIERQNKLSLIPFKIFFNTCLLQIMLTSRHTVQFQRSFNRKCNFDHKPSTGAGYIIGSLPVTESILQTGSEQKSEHSSIDSSEEGS